MMDNNLMQRMKMLAGVDKSKKSNPIKNIFKSEKKQIYKHSQELLSLH